MSLLEIVERLGVTVAMLFFVAYGAWKIVTWLGDRLEKYGEPIVDAHLAFLRKLSSNQEQQTTLLQALDKHTNEQTELLQELRDGYAGNGAAIAEQTDELGRQFDKQTERLTAAIDRGRKTDKP